MFLILLLLIKALIQINIILILIKVLLTSKMVQVIIIQVIYQNILLKSHQFNSQTIIK